MHTSSAPSAVSSSSLVVSRPAAITWDAPNLLATWIAIRPAFPVAPRIATCGRPPKSIRCRSATHEDMAGFIAAATTTGSMVSGSTTLRSSSITVRSAMVPARRVVQDRVAERAGRVAYHGVDTRDERQLTGARVVEPACLRAHPRVQPGRNNLDGDLVASRCDGIGEVPVARGLREIVDDCGFHGVLFIQ